MMWRIHIIITTVKKEKGIFLSTICIVKVQLFREPYLCELK